jgi:hypothetical protein
MKHKWSLPFLSSFRRTPQRRRDDAGEIFRVFVHRLEQMRALSRAPTITGAVIGEKA